MTSGRGKPISSLAGASWLATPETQAVFDAIGRDGAQIRVVGGAVRNALMGRPVGDIDFATTAAPEITIALAEDAGMRVEPVGLSHGTVLVVVNDIAYEVTTLRVDEATDGRHADVRFTDDWEADARRRDFTINSLYADRDGTVHDPLGGIDDIAAGRIRFIGDAGERIREDFLRILRFFRLNAEYGSGPYDEAGLGACVRERHGIGRLSAERVRSELLRLLIAPKALDALNIMFDYGLLVGLLDAVPRIACVARIANLESGLGRAPDSILRLAALSVGVEEDAERLARRLKLSNSARARLVSMSAGAPQILTAPNEYQTRELRYRLGQEKCADRILLAWACSSRDGDDAQWLAALAIAEHWQAPKFPISGADLLALGASEGPGVGEALSEAEEIWIATDFTMDRAELLDRAMSHFKARPLGAV